MHFRDQFRPVGNPGYDRDLRRQLQRVQDSLGQMEESRRGSTGEFPPLNFWQDQDGAMITADVPGLGAADLEVSAVHNTLTLRGKIEAPQLGPNEILNRNERWHGEFVRSVEIPYAIDANNIEAFLHNGVLAIEVPRAQEDKPKQIVVNSPTTIKKGRGKNA